MKSLQYINTMDGTQFVYHPFYNALYKTSKSNNSNCFHDYNDNRKRLPFSNNKTQEDILISHCDFPLPIDSFNVIKDRTLSRKANKKLTFCITQQCNFRCIYCVYGGLYEHMGYRNHTDKVMSFDVIKSTIDYHYVECSKTNIEVIIGFYGGEPLLEFDMIKKTVNYINNKFSNVHYKYTISTNGSLLSIEIIDFLVANEFSIFISIDGAPDIHDNRRVYCDGSGTFKDIYINLLRIREKYPEYYDKSVFFNLTHDNSCNMEDTVHYFCNHNDLFSVDKIIISSIITRDHSIQQHYDDYLSQLVAKSISRFIKVYKPELPYDLLSLYEFNLGKSLLFSQLSFLYNRLFIKRIINRSIHPGGCCYPGRDVLFVDTNGDYYFCQSLASENNCIGNVSMGIDKCKVNKIMREYQDILLDNCKNCWAVSLCRQCFFSIGLNNTSLESLDSICNYHRTEVLSDLQLFCEILSEDKYFFQRHGAKMIYGG